MDLSDASCSSSPASLQLICESRARVALYFAAQQEQLANTQRQLTLDRLVKRLGLHSLTASSTTTGLNSISKQQTVSDAMLNRRTKTRDSMHANKSAGRRNSMLHA